VSFSLPHAETVGQSRHVLAAMALVVIASLIGGGSGERLAVLAMGLPSSGGLPIWRDGALPAAQLAHKQAAKPRVVPGLPHQGDDVSLLTAGGETVIRVQWPELTRSGGHARLEREIALPPPASVA